MNKTDLEYKKVAERLLANIPAEQIQNEKHLRMIFKKQYLRTNEQWKIYDEMIKQAFPGKKRKIKYHKGKPHIPRGTYVPTGYYRIIVIKKYGTITRQAKTDMYIGEKFYRRGMFIPAKIKEKEEK